MYELPTKGDLDRNLWKIIHSARRKARAECARLRVDQAARGMSLNNISILNAAVGIIDPIHEDALAQAMPVVSDFVERMQVAPKQIIAWARYPLENLGLMLLTQIPQAGFPTEHQRVSAQYRLVFQQRLDGSLRDIEIGFIGGRALTSMAVGRPAVSSPKELVSLKPGLWGCSIDLRELVNRGMILLRRTRVWPFA